MFGQQDDSYHEAVMKFVHTVMKAYIANRDMHFSVFIHKAEVLSADYRDGACRVVPWVTSLTIA
jgi:hypothetical protein